MSANASDINMIPSNSNPSNSNQQPSHPPKRIRIPLPSNPIRSSDSDKAIIRAWPIEVVREIERQLGGHGSEVEAGIMSLTQLLDALGKAFTEYKFWPLNTLALRLRQPELHIKAALGQIAIPIVGSSNEIYQLRPAVSTR
ncbi:hypothetical protein N7G274_006562 [Stereocaulon virgatum]|uniref:TFIIF beta subunit HTH domain-containing protein n=1 Tax=Stereocaulon virgatum TaxID=373712 RepID=A0ABR4AB55_9LECA